MLTLKIPNLHISYKCIDTLLYGHNCNSYYVEISMFDYPEKILYSHLLYLLILKSEQCYVKQENLEYVVEDILTNLHELSKKYNIKNIILQELTNEVFYYEITTEYQTFQICCNIIL